MRLKSLVKGDLRFQIKYGFAMIYVILIIIYTLILYSLPDAIRSKAVVILILTDPAAMGLFFMGAILLLEKSQRVLNSIAVSPVKVWEYIVAKAVSISLFSVAVSVILALVTREGYLPGIIIGTLLGSVIFTMIGLAIAVKISSLNQFMIASVPIELIGFVPALFYLFGYRNPWLLFHPACAMVQLYIGNGSNILLCTLVLSIYSAGALMLSNATLRKMIRSIGGIKL